MIHPIFIYLGILFIIGGIATYFVNKNKDSKESKANWLKYLVYLFITIGTILSIQYDLFYILAIIISIFGAIEIFRLVKEDLFKRKASVSILAGYFLLVLFFIQFSLKHEVQNILYVYLIVASFDGFSQISGQLFGKHKLISSISPGKTIEGLIGGIIIATLISFLIRDWIPISTLKAIVFGLIICFFSFTGDILASLIKRLYKVKNYGTILPGHGGVLDRFDSFLFVGASWYFFSQIYG